MQRLVNEYLGRQLVLEKPSDQQMLRIIFTNYAFNILLIDWRDSNMSCRHLAIASAL